MYCMQKNSFKQLMLIVLLFTMQAVFGTQFQAKSHQLLMENL